MLYVPLKKRFMVATVTNVPKQNVKRFKYEIIIIKELWPPTTYNTAQQS